MKNLLIKEARLAVHPTTFIFLSLACLLLIPNYPYFVTYFYMCLGVFFICLTGRENHDIEYTALLPVRKRDLVRARILFVACLEILQIVVALPFVLLRTALIPLPNEVGLDANIVLMGLGFVFFALFNIVFFPLYYKDVKKVGKPFALATIVTTLFMVLVEIGVHAIPYMRDIWDTRDPLHFGDKIWVLVIGIVIFAVGTAGAEYRSTANFEKIDL